MVKPLSVEALILRLMHVLKLPRPFIRSPAFVGPDRRRLGERRNGERRHDQPPSIQDLDRRRPPGRRTGDDRRRMPTGR